MELNILENRLKLSTIDKKNVSKLMHPLIRIGILGKTGCHFFSLTETRDDYSLVMDESAYSELPAESVKFVQTAEQTWTPLCVSAGAYTTASMTGISKMSQSLIEPLADNGITIYSLSTYQTDFILVQTRDIHKVIACLSSHDVASFPNHQDQVFTVPLDKINTCTYKSKERVLKHHVCYPDAGFHITSIDRDGLQNIGLALIEQLFYRSDRKNEEEEPFFSFSVVDGDISMLMDTQTFSRFPDSTVFADDECWRMIKIGNINDSLGFSETGIVAQILSAIAETDILAYYISTYYSDHTLVPEESLEEVKALIESHMQTGNEPSGMYNPGGHPG